jgi:GT2 family glycosyltransferase
VVATARTALCWAAGAPLDAIADGGGRLAALAQEMRVRFPPVTLPDPGPAPEVSVIVPAHGRFELTHDCLHSIAEVGATARFEVILVDDGSTDETLLAELVFPGARVLRRATAGGFLSAVNAGAAVARGGHLLFLNNDTRVEPGWLDELLGTFAAMPEVGIAGAKLIHPDGTLQEAGGVVGRFGEAMNWGYGEDPDDPRFCHLRDADYVSGAAMMIPRALFERLGGFDAAFAPGYYEDTDLCFRVREQTGLRVVVQPLSRVIHLEGGTAGRDIATRGMKRHQLLNQPVFFRRWRDVLASHRPAGEDPALEAERRVARRAVFVDELVPTPDRDAGSNAAFDHMCLLQKLGYAVSFVPSADMRHRGRYTDALRRRGIACLHAPHVNSVEEALRCLPVAPDLVYLHRGAVAARYIGLVRDLFPAAHILYSVADLHFLRLAREAEATADPSREAEAARSAAAELGAVRAADAVIVHSHAEATLLVARVPEARVHVVPWTLHTTKPAPPTGRAGVAFVGGYAHRPNVDGALHLVRDVMPAAWRALPDLPCLLVGSEMPREIALLAGPRIEALGHVPDLGQVFARVRCTAAPLRYGAGIKGKVLTSLAHGVPCVMSPVAAEGIAFPDPLLWLVADTADAMAEKLVALHADDALCARLAAEGLDFVRGGFGEAAVLRALAAATLPG